MKTVIVTSFNPVKNNAVKLAFTAAFPQQQFEFESLEVSSDVSDQPKSKQETRQGAENRVGNTRRQKPNADYYVGLEGGIEVNDRNELRLLNWVLVENKSGKQGSSNSGALSYQAKLDK